jgi:hypothetical protein
VTEQNQNDPRPTATAIDAPAARDDRHDDRRLEPRIPHRAVIVMPFGEGVDERFEKAEMLDCSSLGIGLLVERPFRKRSRFFVKLKLTNVALVIYEVKHCTQTPEGFRIGAEYHGVIGNETDRESTPEHILAALLAL